MPKVHVNIDHFLSSFSLKVIRSGDYYQFEGDPEDEEDEETTTTLSTSETVHYQGDKQLGPREKLQRNHIRAAWPNATSAQLDVLANYTCPYSPSPSQ